MSTVTYLPDQLRRKRVGEMPLLHHLAKRLRFDELLASHISAHGNEKIPAAQSLLLLVFNITSGRMPLYELPQWTTDFDGRLIGQDSELPESLFNDDRYARALDKPYLADRASLMTDLVLACHGPGTATGFVTTTQRLHQHQDVRIDARTEHFRSTVQAWTLRGSSAGFEADRVFLEHHCRRCGTDTLQVLCRESH